MSYTRSYREIITVSGSKTVSVSYPASQNGGTTSATVNYTEEVPVNVNIDVDTLPFDNSVAHCNTNVNLLTGAVVATEAAQVISIDQNSKKVADTVITGFFGYIRYEISQQVAELVQTIDANLMHLKGLAVECLSKKEQMEVDFLRISGRYAKIFDDLNHEVANRVYELDKPAFVFKKELDNQKIRASENDLVNTVGVFGKESGELQSKISASIAKKRAFDSINKARIFLWHQKKMNHTVQKSMLNESSETTYFSPVCFFETKRDDKVGKGLFSPSFISALQGHATRDDLIAHFSDANNKWQVIPTAYNDKLKLYFNSELNKSFSTVDQHSLRVKEMIQKIANLGSINTIGV
jgi:hypothetical protein